MTIINSEVISNVAVLVANSGFGSSAANVGRITLAGLLLPTVFGSVTPAESLTVNVYAGANGLSNDVLVFSETVFSNNGIWAADLLVGKPATVAGNVQVKITSLTPPAAMTSPTTNGAVNVAAATLLSVYVAPVGGGSNGLISVETGIIANVTGF